MKSSGLRTFITAVVVALIVSGTAVFISIQYNQTQKNLVNAQQEARKQCAENIPNDDNSADYWAGTYTNYTNYPKFDKCMASKGF